MHCADFYEYRPQTVVKARTEEEAKGVLRVAMPATEGRSRCTPKTTFSGTVAHPASRLLP